MKTIGDFVDAAGRFNQPPGVEVRVLDNRSDLQFQIESIDLVDGIILIEIDLNNEIIED